MMRSEGGEEGEGMECERTWRQVGKMGGSSEDWDMWVKEAAIGEASQAARSKIEVGAYYWLR